MLTQGRSFHDKEAPIATNETGRRQKFYRDKVVRLSQVGVRNQQNLYPRIPTTDVAKLLQYSGSRVEHRDGFSS